jgi:hypothetical protein
MLASQAFAIIIGMLVLVCLLMPGITRYVIVGSLIMLLADYAVNKATAGSVNLIPFLSL